MLVEVSPSVAASPLPSNSTGGVKMLALATGAYSRIRRQFKLPIGKMEGLKSRWHAWVATPTSWAPPPN